jgi:hypothetical protein
VTPSVADAAALALKGAVVVWLSNAVAEVVALAHVDGDAERVTDEDGDGDGRADGDTATEEK